MVLSTHAPGVSDFVLTSQGFAILEVFLANPDKPRYGLELMKETGLSSGTVYPNLLKFEQAGWLASAPEPIDPTEEARPRRRIFTLTAEGARSARYAISAFRRIRASADGLRRRGRKKLATKPSPHKPSKTDPVLTRPIVADG